MATSGATASSSKLTNHAFLSFACSTTGWITAVTWKTSSPSTSSLRPSVRLGAVVYVTPTGQFRTVKSFDDLKGLLTQNDSDSVERIVSELQLNGAPPRATR
jgi:hypothetical protein